eukprot:4108240-Karenia_brevis.AAC.1
MDVEGQSDASALNVLVEDPIVEAAYEELPDDDKLEFRDLKDAFQRKRARHRSAHSRVAAVKRKQQEHAAKRVRRRLAFEAAQGQDPAPPAPAPAAPAPAAPAAPLPDPQPDLAAIAPSSEEELDAEQPVAKARAKAKHRVRNDGTAGQTWGKHFRIARTNRHGQFIALTVTCKFHE